MNVLIQGDNKPIVLEMDEPVANITQFSAILYWNDTKYKRWDMSNVLLSDTEIKLPLSQTDTLGIKDDYVELEVKLLDSSDIEFFEIIPFIVQKRIDSTIFQLEGEPE